MPEEIGYNATDQEIQFNFQMILVSDRDLQLDRESKIFHLIANITFRVCTVVQNNNKSLN